MPVQSTARPASEPSVDAGAPGHICKRVLMETLNTQTSSDVSGTKEVIAVCEDCAGSGFDSSDYQIWCPSCGGTGAARDGYVVAAGAQSRLTNDRPVIGR